MVSPFRPFLSSLHQPLVAPLAAYQAITTYGTHTLQKSALQRYNLCFPFDRKSGQHGKLEIILAKISSFPIAHRHLLEVGSCGRLARGAVLFF